MTSVAPVGCNASTLYRHFRRCCCWRFHIGIGCHQQVFGVLYSWRVLTCSLQAEAKDVVQTVEDIDVVLASLKEVVNTIDQQHDAWFQELELMCRSVHVVPSIPRRCARQRHRNNVPSEDPRTYYRRCISVPLVDHLLAELETRFSPHHRVALLGLCLVPSPLVTLHDLDVKSHLAKLVDLYEDDLASPESVSHQMVSWKIKWQQQMEQHGKACLPTSPSQALQHAPSLYPDIRVLLLVLCTLPVTSCSSERSFSTLKRIQTYLRSTCGNERLTSLALMHIHRDVPVCSKEMVDKVDNGAPPTPQADEHGLVTLCDTVYNT